MGKSTAFEVFGFCISTATVEGTQAVQLGLETGRLQSSIHRHAENILLQCSGHESVTLPVAINRGRGKLPRGSLP